MRSSILTRVLGILLLAGLVGALIGWWVSRNPRVPVPTLMVENPAPVSPTTPEVTPETNSLSVTQASVVVPPPAKPDDTNAVDAPTWEDKLDDILTSDTDTAKKGDQLLDLMPTVGEDAQVELAGHIINLVDDTNYSRVAPYLTNAEVPEAVSSVFMNDLYNRANSLKLPMVLAVARNEKHPLHEQAKDLLELYLEEDNGTNWNKWETTMNSWLKEHPDEEQ